jgi:hypothetical protein
MLDCLMTLISVLPKIKPARRDMADHLWIATLCGFPVTIGMWDVMIILCGVDRYRGVAAGGGHRIAVDLIDQLFLVDDPHEARCR